MKWNTWHWSKGRGKKTTRFRSACSTSMLGDVFQITDFGKGPMLHAAMKKMDDIGCGVLVYLNKLRQGGGILDELTAYKRIQKATSQHRREWTPKITALAPKSSGNLVCAIATYSPTPNAPSVPSDTDLPSRKLRASTCPSNIDRKIEQQKRDRFGSLFDMVKRRSA